MNRITKAIAGTLAGAALFATAFAGVASAQPLDNISLLDGTNINVCVIASFDDLLRLKARVNGIVDSPEVADRRLLDSIDLLDLDLLTTEELGLLGFDRTMTRGDILEQLEALNQVDVREFNLAKSLCDDVVPTTTVTTPPATTTTAPPTVSATRTVTPTTSTRAPSTDFTVPRGSVDTGAP